MENLENNKPNIETLKKVQYISLNQFCEDINRNFAIIETSPFYKGIPGNPGDEGNPGGQGIRGSITVFVKLSNFNKYFQNTITAASNINLDWLNLKLKNSDDKVKLLQCFDINTFVHGDIVVLTNTLMISYNGITEQFVDTGIAFNEQSQIINNLDKKIEDYVKFYVDNNISIKNLKTIFAGYDTYAKNFGENNSVFISSTITNSSIYAPYIEGVTSTQGTKVPNHRYWGLVDVEFGKDETGTIVFGSMKKYTELLMKTTLTDSNETLTSDYAPGVNNIPAAVFLQDTPNNGIMIGWKDNVGKNLRRFGQIFKNEANEFVIQSDAGNDANTNGSDYSSIYLHKDYLKYKKLVKFENNLELKRDFISDGNISNKFIRTGLEYADSADQIIVGLVSTTSRYKNISKVICLDNFKNKVLVTDDSGLILSNYQVEKGELNLANLLDNNKITTHVADNMPEIYKTSIITTEYFSFLAKKINNLITYIGNNFFKKSEFTSGSITETIKLGGNLEVLSGSINAQNINITGSINMKDADSQKKTIVVDANTGNVILGKVDTENVGILTIRTKDTVVDSSIVKMSKFKNVLFVTDADGNISKSYSLLTESYPTDFTQKPTVSSDNSKVLTGIYLKWLVDMIYSKTANIQGDYYTKANFGDNSIPNLRLNSILKVGSTATPFFVVQQSDKSLLVGNETEKASITFNTSKLTLLGISKSSETSTNYLLSIDANGEVKSLLTDLGNKVKIDTTDKDKLSGGPSKSYEIVTGDNFAKLVSSINSIISQIGQLTVGGDGSSLTDYVLKSSLTDNSISTIMVNSSFYATNEVHLGGEDTDMMTMKNFGDGHGWYTKFLGNIAFGTPKPSNDVKVDGTRFLTTYNCFGEIIYQPSDNKYRFWNGNDGSLNINEISPVNENNPRVADNRYVVTFDQIKTIANAVNILKELVGGSGSGSGSGGGEFYTKAEMIAGLSISAKFAGKEYNLGDTVYAVGDSTYIGYSDNRGYTYMNNDVRFKQYTNYPIVSFDSNGKPTKTYIVSTRGVTTIPTWNNPVTLHNDANSTTLLTTQDANYLIKSINLMKDKMVELNNSSGGISSSDVKSLIWAQMPIGMIIGWYYNTIPSGWQICDGSNGTPNLIGRHIKGATTTGETGGTNSVTLTVDHLPSHNHSINIDNAGEHKHSIGEVIHGYFDYTTADGAHTHYVNSAGNHNLDNVSTIRIPKSNIDYTGTYDFGCIDGGKHIHDMMNAGSHWHIARCYNAGLGNSFSVESAFVNLVFIMKIENK